MCETGVGSSAPHLFCIQPELQPVSPRSLVRILAAGEALEEAAELFVGLRNAQAERRSPAVQLAAVGRRNFLRYLAML